MQNIKCENPVIIENPYLRFLVSKFQKVWLKDHWINFAALDKLKSVDVVVKTSSGSRVETIKQCNGQVQRNRFVWSDWESKYHPIFYKSRTGVSLDTIDDFYILTYDGEVIPVYLAVPCGHCSLCKEKKARDWQTRCLAETAMSDYPPLFITLTYRNSDLPEHGVDKEECQKFMKRLRTNTNRHLGIKSNLRFILCAEYGKKNHRAHYHMLLWNMPFVSNVGKNSWQALHDHISKAWSHGWIGLERCIDYSGKYCMKYLRKQCHVPDGCEPVFMLSSRRGGIGRAFADSLLDHARKTPQMPSFDILNKFDGSTTRCSVPVYFKRIWFPSLSGIVKQDVRDAVSKFLELARCESYVLSKFLNIASIDSSATTDVTWYLDDLLSMFNDVEERFSFCVDEWRDTTPSKINRTDIDAAMKEVLSCFIPSLHEEFLKGAWHTDLLDRLKSAYHSLDKFRPDKKMVQQLLDLHSTHSELMLELAKNCDSISVTDEVARVHRDNVRLERGLRSDESLYLNES